MVRDPWERLLSAYRWLGFSTRFLTRQTMIFIFRNKLEVVGNEDQVELTFPLVATNLDDQCRLYFNRQLFMSPTGGTWCQNTDRRGCNDLERLFTGF